MTTHTNISAGNVLGYLKLKLEDFYASRWTHLRHSLSTF